jgi:hypothetical protein|tara:strand:+ start:302 stop:1489 length:1188 start_codon:yes stop_codon:yes gene_type:complete
MKGKKGQILIYGLIAGIIAAIIVMHVNNVQTSQHFGIIGESSIKTLEQSKEAEKALFYLDQSAKYAASQLIFDLAAKGGCETDKKYFGNNIWDFEDCNPEPNSVKEEFLNIFPKVLNNYLLKYKFATFPEDNYEVKFNNNDLLGIAKNSIKFLFIKEGKVDAKFSGSYSVKPSFRAELDYDFSDYDWLVDQAKKMKKFVAECKKERPPIETLIGISIEPSTEALTDASTEECVGLSDSQGFFLDFEDHKFSLLLTCEEEKKEEFNNLKEYIELCTASKIPEGKDGCVCRNKPKAEFYYLEENNGIKISEKGLWEEGKSLIGIDEDLLHKDKDRKLILEKDIESSHQCITEKTTYRFCVQTDKKIYAYDEDDKKVALRPIIYEFALDFSEEQVTEE